MKEIELCYLYITGHVQQNGTPDNEDAQHAQDSPHKHRAQRNQPTYPGGPTQEEEQENKEGGDEDPPEHWDNSRHSGSEAGDPQDHPATNTNLNNTNQPSDNIYYDDNSHKISLEHNIVQQ